MCVLFACESTLQKMSYLIGPSKRFPYVSDVKIVACLEIDKKKITQNELLIFCWFLKIDKPMKKLKKRKRQFDGNKKTELAQVY